MRILLVAALATCGTTLGPVRDQPRATMSAPDPDACVVADVALDAFDEVTPSYGEFPCSGDASSALDAAVPTTCCHIAYGVRYCASSAGTTEVAREVPVPAIRNAAMLEYGGALVMSSYQSIFVSRTFTGPLEPIVVEGDPFVPFKGDEYPISYQDDGTMFYRSTLDPRDDVVFSELPLLPRPQDYQNPTPTRFVIRVRPYIFAQTRSGRLVIFNSRGDVHVTAHARIASLNVTEGVLRYVVEPGCLRELRDDREAPDAACVRADWGTFLSPHVSHAPRRGLEIARPPEGVPNVRPVSGPSGDAARALEHGWQFVSAIRGLSRTSHDVDVSIDQSTHEVRGTCDGGALHPIAAHARSRSCVADACFLDGHRAWARPSAVERFSRLERIDHSGRLDTRARSESDHSYVRNAHRVQTRRRMQIFRDDVAGGERRVYSGGSCFPRAELIGASDALSVFRGTGGLGILVHGTEQCRAYDSQVFGRVLPLEDGSLLVGEGGGHVIHVKIDGSFVERAFACERELALAERDGNPGVVCVHHDRRTARFYGFDDSVLEVPYPNGSEPTCEATRAHRLRTRFGDDAGLVEWQLDDGRLCIAGRYAPLPQRSALGE